MKTKLFTLLTLLLCAITSAWADVITWNTTDNSTASDVTLSANYNFTGDDGKTVLTYANPNSCKRLKNNGGLYMNGASQWNNSKAQRHFTFKAPSSAGTVSITFAAINGKSDGTGSATVKIYGGTTVAYDVSTLNSSLTSPMISGLQAGTSDVIITFDKKCTIKEIKWTDVAAPSYVIAYANDFTATPMGAASVAYTGMSAIASSVTGWMGWDNTYSNGYVSSTATCNATLTFTTPLTLASNGVDCGRIRIYWGHSSNGKTLGLKVNGSSVSFNPASVATSLYPKTLNMAEYTIPLETTSINSIQPSGSGSTGTYLFRIEILTYASIPGAITFDPAAGSVETGTPVTLSSTNATTIKYQWGSSAVDGDGSWESATTYNAETKPSVPAYGSSSNVLSVWAHNDSGDTYGSASYTITATDNTAPTLTNQSIAANATEVATAGNITLTFDENVQVADASGVTLTGGAATISSVTAEDNVVTIAYTGLAYNTAYTLAVANGAITDIATAHNAYAGTSFSFTTAKEAMPNPTISGDGYFVGSQTVTITSDVDGATITYSLDGETYSAYTEPIVLTATKTVYAKATHANYSGEGTANKAMYLVSAPIGQEDVTDDTEWGFGDGLNPGENVTNDEIPLTELLSTVSGYAEKEGATQITFIKPQRYDKGGYVQAHGFIINTSVPGKLSINFTNGNGDLRYLMVNGVKKGQISSSGANVNANDIEIPAGTIVVYGHNVPTNAPNNLRYKKITFTPATETVTYSSP